MQFQLREKSQTGFEDASNTWDLGYGPPSPRIASTNGCANQTRKVREKIQEKLEKAKFSFQEAGQNCDGLLQMISDALPNSAAVQAVMANASLLKVAEAAFCASLRSAAEELPDGEAEEEEEDLFQVCHTSRYWLLDIIFLQS